MLFNSYIFVLFFLPCCIGVYFALNRMEKPKMAMCFLLGMSLWFYGFFNPSYLLIICTSIVINYLFYRIMRRCRAASGGKTLGMKLLLVVALLLNVGLLFYFKYFDFFIENINILFRTDFMLRHIMLPLGISFFTFQQLSFVIDAYKGELPDYQFIDYACFVTYFPQLVAGPIVTHDELVPQFMDQSKKRFNWDNFAQGLYAFVMGLAKKVLLADVLGVAVNWGFGNIEGLDAVEAVIVTFAYTMQIYFDFSGYCDMAIGMAKMMNIDLPLNFDSPYKALDIREFWDRWHKTLTRFFTNYIYIPLGGSRRGALRTYLNIMIVYLVSGIWHGANWTFIFWGICHGLFCVLTRHFDRFFKKLPPVLGWLLTFVFVNVMWIFFRADSIADAFVILRKIGSLSADGINPDLVNCFVTAEWKLVFTKLLRTDFVKNFPTIIMGATLLIPFATVLGMDNVYERMCRLKPTFLKAIIIAAVLVLCICSFSGVSTFLYFNF